VPTAEIFSDELLTRDTKPVTIADFLARRNSDAGWPDSFGRNDMQQVVTSKYAEVAQVVKWLYNVTPSRMTGSGASVFAVFRSRHEAEAVKANLPTGWNGAVAESLNEHPLFAFAS
jgi:4-diphosphocytidyl-2-C-methyl-D-erythritol kinase